MNSVGFLSVVFLALAPGCALLTKSEPVIPRYFSAGGVGSLKAAPRPGAARVSSSGWDA